MVKNKGYLMIVAGCLVLTIALIIMIVIPSWGHWIGDYPDTITLDQLPAETQTMAAPMVSVLKGFLGPLIYQIGEYMAIVGYFMGTLFTLISLGIISMGIGTIRSNKK